MAKLKDKVQTTLDEGRMLILGSQVLLGFQFRAAFEKGFEQLPEHARYAKFGGLLLMVAALALLILPSAYHRIVNEGEDTEELNAFASYVMGYALLPFALGLGADFFVAGERLLGTWAGLGLGVAACAVALFFWYGLEAVRRAEREPRVAEKEEMEEQKKEEGQEQEQEPKLKDMIRHVLTEARMVLPGAQALLGFQLAAFLTEGFDKLPSSSKWAHFASLSAVAVSIVLLMTPAAYHRIVERGQETRHFHNFASRVLVAAMVPLALGISGDVYVVGRKVSESSTFGVVFAALALLTFYGLWFGLTLYRRGAKHGAARRASSRVVLTE